MHFHGVTAGHQHSQGIAVMDADYPVGEHVCRNGDSRHGYTLRPAPLFRLFQAAGFWLSKRINKRLQGGPLLGGQRLHRQHQP
jgi:hypothetical protein